MSVENCSFYGSGANYWHAFAYADSSIINLRNCYAVATGSVAADYGNVLVLAASGGRLNLYNSFFSSSTNATASPVLAENGATINAYFCIIDGSGAGAKDVTQSGAGDLNLYNCLLVNGTTSGTIDYLGVGTIGATTIGGAASAGAGKQYVELSIGGVKYKLLHDGTI